MPTEALRSGGTEVELAGWEALARNLLDDPADLPRAGRAFISDGGILKNMVIEVALKVDPP